MPLVFAMAAMACWSQDTYYWYNAVSTEDYCRYYIPDRDIGYDWITPGFDDSGWTYAQSGIGYGDGDDNTVIQEGVYSLYLRYSFGVTDGANVKQVILDMDYDDGFVAYLNGVEIASGNITKPYSWNMLLDRDHEAALFRGLLPERWIINDAQMNEALVAGENILAVEIHNHQPTSSDMSSNTFLHIGFSEQQNGYKNVMDWFVPPVTLKSHLPIINISTNGVAIPD